MRSRSRTSARRGTRLLPLLSLSFLFLFIAPYGASLLAPATGASPALAPAASGSATGSVFWNGINTDTAPNGASGISWSFTNVATVVFNWSGAPTPGVSQAFLVILFLGFPAYTKQQVQSIALTSGTISMTYDLTQFKWYLQGLFQVHAYLETPGGSSVWSETFYVRVAQPYDIVVATVGLLLLTIAELYMIATVGPRAADKFRQAQLQQQTQQLQEEEAQTPTTESAESSGTPSSPQEKS